MLTLMLSGALKTDIFGTQSKYILATKQIALKQNGFLDKILWVESYFATHKHYPLFILDFSEKALQQQNTIKNEAIIHERAFYPRGFYLVSFSLHIFKAAKLAAF